MEIKYHTVDAEMFIGLRFYPGIFITTFSPIDGISRQPHPVTQRGLGSLGAYLAQDIGKRVYNGQVENDEQVKRSTGLTFEQRKAQGEHAIKVARAKYKGEKDIWGHII